MAAMEPFDNPSADEEWLEWFSLTPAQRFVESQELWILYRALGGSLDPEPDEQSPFYRAEMEHAATIDIESRVRSVWRRLMLARRRRHRPDRN